MKRFALILAVLILAAAASAQTELYHRYASQEGVRVASVTGLALDSTAAVDATLIVADDDAGWEWMKREFQIADLPAGQQEALRAGNDVVLFARRDRHNPALNAPVAGEQIDAAQSCFMGISYLERAVYLFCADSEAQSNAIVARLVNKMMGSHPAH